MTDLTEFEVKFYENFAEKFVDIYEIQGAFQAGVYAVEHVKKEKMPEAKPFVEAAFEARGYTFDEEGEG